MKKRTKRKIQAMVEGGHKLAKIRTQLEDLIKPGISLEEIDKQAEKWLLKTGGQPALCI